MNNSEAEIIEKMINELSQNVSYKLADLIMGYPDFLRPVVMATVQACITANMQTIPEKERELYEAALSKMTVVTIPSEMDPRKRKGKA